MKRILEDIRAHMAPIIAAVTASVIIGHIGLVAAAVCVIAAGAWLAWRKGWRLSITTHEKHQQEDSEHGTDPHTDPQ